MQDPAMRGTMKTIAIDNFGGIDKLKPQTLPIPEPDPDEVLIRIDTAGVGVWDPPDREGTLAKMRDSEPSFPYILGRDGAGIIVATGDQVDHLKEGDRVYTFGPPDPEANLYAEYATAKAKNVAPMPDGLSLEEAGALPTDAVTAFCGLDRVLDLQSGETILIVGASGGLGHFAIQLAKRMGANVFAIASGQDGVEFVQKLGANAAVDGKNREIAEATHNFIPDGFDAALVTIGGEIANQVLTAMRDGGRVAYPNGVNPIPEVPTGVELQAFNGEASPEIFAKLNRLIDSGPFTVHIDRMFPLDQAADAHRALDEHYLGRIALKVDELE